MIIERLENLSNLNNKMGVEFSKYLEDEVDQDVTLKDVLKVISRKENFPFYFDDTTEIK